MKNKENSMGWAARPVWSGLVMAAGLLWLAPLQAEVELPSGQYHHTMDDLVVKVPGGQIRAQRTWYEQRWHFNRSWNDLTIEYDNLDGSVKAIERNGDTYVRGADGARFTFDLRKYILKTDTGFRWEDREGNWIEYDAQGRVLAYGDRNDNGAGFVYEDGRRTGVTDRAGTQVLWYEYDAQGRLTAVRDDGDPARRVEYRYTGDLISEVTDVLGHTWAYEYDSAGRLAKLLDPDGRPTQVAYDKLGRAASVTRADGTGSFYEYDYDSSKKEYFTRTRVSSGKVTETWYDREGLIVRRDVNGKTVERIQKDGRRRIHTNGLGQKTVRDYDEWDNLLKVTWPDGATRSYEVDRTYSRVTEETDERGTVTRYTYDDEGNLTRKVEAVGTPVERTTEYTYDADGHLLEEKRLGDAATQTAATAYTYDEAGNPKTITDPEGHVTRFDQYDAMGNLLAWRDGRGKTWIREYDAKGQIVSQTDPLGRTTTYEYDGAGNRTVVIDPLNHQTVYTYDQNGRLTSVTDALGGVTKNVYAANGQRASVLDPDGNPKRFGYNAQGRLSQLIDGNGNTITYHWGGADQNAHEDAVAKIEYPTFVQEYRYDTRGQRTLTIDHNGAEQILNATAYDAAGNVMKATDPNGNATTYTYDALGRLTVVTNPLGDTVEYTYDNRDNLVAVKNENGIIIRRFEYDRNDNQVKEIWPGGETFWFAYDANRNLAQKIDGKGQVAKYTYDEANQLFGIAYFADAGVMAPEKVVTFTYNDAGSLTGYSDGSTSGVYTYDALQRKIGETLDYGVFQKSFAYTYTPAGRKRSFTRPDGVTVTFGYDEAGQLVSMGLPDVGTISWGGFQWNAPTRVTLPGGGKIDRSYDALLRPTRITGKDPASNTLLDFAYSFDPAGNILGKDTEHGPYRYGYDALDRLVQVGNPTLDDEGYTYDGAGNRLTTDGVDGALEYLEGNQLVALDSSALSYDANGSLVEKTESGAVTKYLYNLENRLSEVLDVTDSTIAEYGYDPFGRRLWKDVGGVRTYFLYAEEGLVAEMNTSGVVTRQYGWKPDGMWGTDPVYLSAGSETYFYQNDHLGTPQKMVSVNGTVVWAAKYKAFGAAYSDVRQVDNSLRFPGQYHDQESDLDYNYLRFYEAETGRYTTSDPMGIFGGSNTYQYTLGNPLIRIDPWGLFCIPLPRGTTDWEEKWRSKRIVHTLTGVIFDDVRGPLGNCLWVKSQSVTEERKWRPRQLCFECDLCGGGDCGFKIKRGDWERERRHRSDTDLATSAAARIVIGNDIEVGDRWWCNNPWTGHRVTGKM